MASTMRWDGLKDSDDVCPRASIHHGADGVMGDMKPLTQCSSGHASRMLGANAADHFGGEFGLWKSFATRSGFWMQAGAAGVTAGPVAAALVGG